MELGMYTKELRRPTVESLFESVRALGFAQVQFDFSSVCGEELPREIPSALAERIARAAGANGVKIAAVNGTFNMIAPDPAERADGLKRLAVLAASCAALNCGLITLCSGSRSPEGMWRWHPDNGAEAAWDDMRAVMDAAVAIAERYDVCLGLECEASNVVNSPEKGRRLLDEIGSPRLKVIMDCANLFQRGEAHPENVRGIMKNAFDLLGRNIALAHGKDILEGPGLDFAPAGQGIVDFDYYRALLAEYGYSGGMILHGIKREEDFSDSVRFMSNL
ncbi:MAG: sugar phosphate isomerase/epimerase [Clostridiales bacterium]|jgi:sugar phosphate isomerase/epimerase|nr:sugar phosphate isomerase/epimerase [Clostridiales bacterium]